MRWTLIALLVFFVQATGVAAQPVDPPITITFVDETGLNSQAPVIVSMIAAPGEPAAALPPRIEPGTSQRAWRVEFQPPLGAWVIEPSFLLRIPERKPAGALRSTIPASEIRLSFRIRAIFDPRNYVIALRLFPDTTDSTLAEIERMPARERLTQILLLQQLARYRVGVRALDQRTKRTVALLYDRVFQAMSDDDLETRHPVRFDSDILNLIETSFADRDERWRYDRFVRDYELTGSSFWGERVRMLPYVLESGRCDMARLLVGYVRSQHALDKDAARIQGIPDPLEQIAAMEGEIQSTCTNNDGAPL